MDFLDPQKQRRNTIQLFAGYFLMTIMFALVLVILIQYVQGIGVTRKGEIIQKGLIFVSSQPSGADLYIDGKRVETTNAKLNINEGDHTLDLERAGYNGWHRNITVKGGGVDHFVYPFLFPKKLATKTIKTFADTPSLVTQSPDRRWLVTLDNPETAVFEVLDLNKTQAEVGVATDFSVPEALLTTSTTPARWELVEWSTNNRHMLLKRYFTPAKTTTETFEYILADRQRPEGSHNLSKDLGVTPTQLSLRDKKPDSYYLYDEAAQTLSTATLNEPTPVLDIGEVLAYKSHGSDTVVYATKEKSSTAKVAIKFRQGAEDFPIRTVPESSTYLLDVARFEDNWYVVMGTTADNKVYIYKNPAAAATADNVRNGALFALRVDNPTHVSFSANTQYILAQNSTEARIYDIDHAKSYYYPLPYPVDAPQTKITWMDGDRLTYVSGSKQVVFDYDNINAHTLVNTLPALPAMFDREYKYMYSFTNSTDNPNGLTLSATPLRTTGDL